MARPKKVDEKAEIVAPSFSIPSPESHPAPIPSVTVPQANIKVEVTPEPKEELFERYDWLRMPIGMFDFNTAGKLFRSINSIENKKIESQYRALLDAGYVVKHSNIDQGYVYMFMEKL